MIIERINRIQPGFDGLFYLYIRNLIRVIRGELLKSLFIRKRVILVLSELEYLTISGWFLNFIVKSQFLEATHWISFGTNIIKRRKYG